MDALNYTPKVESIEAPMIWFLLQSVQNDPACEPEYFIINAEDTVAGETSNTHAEGLVQFYQDGKLIEGKIIRTAGSKESAENYLYELNRPVPIQVQLETKTRYLILQYSKKPTSLIQSIVPEKEVTWPTPTQPNQREVFIHDGRQKLLATVLCIHEDEAFIEREFLKLKQFCFEKGMDENDENFTIGDDDWILGLYTCGPGNVVYVIMKNSTTYLHALNPHKDVIVYLSDDHSVYQIIVVRKAPKMEDLMPQLKIMRDSCLTVGFPLEIDIDRPNAVPPPDFESFCGSVESFDKFFIDQRLVEMNPVIEDLETAMQGEAAWVACFMEIMSNARHISEQRRIIIVDSLPFL